MPRSETDIGTRTIIAVCIDRVVRVPGGTLRTTLPTFRDRGHMGMFDAELLRDCVPAEGK